jgi:hypothetical protein
MLQSMKRLLPLVLLSCAPTTEPFAVGNLPDLAGIQSGPQVRIVPLAVNYRFGPASYNVPAPGQWFDTMLGTPCQVAKDTLGKARCLPLPISIRYYTDGGCTQPVGYQAVESCIPAPAPAAVKWVTIGSSIACGAPVFAVNQEIKPDSLWDMESGNCAPTDMSGLQGRFFTLGAEARAEEFAEAELTATTLPGQLLPAG